MSEFQVSEVWGLNEAKFTSKQFVYKTSIFYKADIKMQHVLKFACIDYSFQLEHHL